MRTLVMGDLHGANKALEQCLERSNFNPGSDTLIQLGDVTDKKSGVFECVEILLELSKKNSLIAIRGNHDEWFMNFINFGKHPANWGFGGDLTIQSYNKNLNHELNLGLNTIRRFQGAISPKDIPNDHKAFFTNQLSHYIDAQNNCYIHGGFNRYLPFKEQNVDEYYFNRKLWLDAMQYEVSEQLASEIFFMNPHFREVFIGHTPTTNWYTDLPMHCANVWNLDTGICSGGKLTIMDVNTKEFWQSDIQRN